MLQDEGVICQSNSSREWNKQFIEKIGESQHWGKSVCVLLCVCCCCCLCVWEREIPAVFHNPGWSRTDPQLSLLLISHNTCIPAAIPKADTHFSVLFINTLLILTDDKPHIIWPWFYCCYFVKLMTKRVSQKNEFTFQRGWLVSWHMNKFRF